MRYVLTEAGNPMKQLLAMAALLMAAGETPDKAALLIHAAGTEDAHAGQATKLIGPDARIQLVVTLKDAAGKLLDLTGKAAYSVAPEGVLSVDATGLLAPLKDGSATVTVKHEGLSGSVTVGVEKFGNPDPINFPRIFQPGNFSRPSARRRVGPPALQDVGPVESRRHHPNPDLAFPGIESRDLEKRQNLGPPGTGENDRPHDRAED